MTIDLIMRAFEAYDDSKRIDGGKPQVENLIKYRKALSLAKQLASQGKLRSVEYDDVNDNFVYHNMVIGLSEDEYTAEELNMLAELLKQFDKASFISDGDDVDVSLIIENLYA